jgi:hypothetical protein
LTDFAEDFDASITSRDPGVASSHKILLAGLCGLPARSGRWNKKPTARPRAPITYGVDAGGALGRAHLGRSARPDELDPHFVEYAMAIAGTEATHPHVTTAAAQRASVRLTLLTLKKR